MLSFLVSRYQIETGRLFFFRPKLSVPLIVLLIAQFLSSLFTPDLVVGQGSVPTGAMSGYIPGELTITERGTASYVIPITVLPGTAGLQPKLSLNYDSRASNGYLGVGWSLGGFPVIARCPTTIAQDGFIDAVNFNSNDKLCLDGQRLTVISGSYWQSLSEYRTENESFSRITYTSTGGFQVNTKDGLVYHYGESTDSRVEAQGRSDVLAWKLNKIVDRMGNYMDILYYEDNPSGQSYVTTVSYTANTSQGIIHRNHVRFIYEDRPDPIILYSAGSKQSILKRLKSIDIVRQTSLARQYRLNYEVGNNTFDSRLVSLDQCDKNNICLNPTSFDWSNSSPQFNQPFLAITNGEGLGEPPYGTIDEGFADFNGDGKTDRFWVRGSRVSLGISNGSDFIPQAWSLNSQTPQTTKVNSTSDFNADGIPDYVFRAGSSNIHVAQSSANGFQSVNSWATPPNNQSAAEGLDHFGDVNGDGRADHVYSTASWSGGGDIYAKISNGSSFNTPQIWLPSSQIDALPESGAPCAAKPYSYQGSHEAFLDLNGDGLTDYIWIPRCFNGWYAALSTGSGFAPPTRWLAADVAPGGSAYNNTGYGRHEQFADVTGDGLPDYIWRPNNYNQLWVAVNDGTKFINAQPWAVEGEFSGLNPYSLNGLHENYVDMNGDGRADLVWVPVATNGASDNRLWVAYSNGSDFVGAHVLLSASDIAGQLPYPHETRPEGFPDINGDGLADYSFIPNGANDLWAAIKSGETPNLLRSITDGHGKLINIQYKPLSDPAVYLKQSSGVYPTVNIQGSMYVVSSYQTSDGIGGLRSTGYFYRGLKASVDGRGYCGFASIVKTDHLTGDSTTNQYRQDFPFKSLLKRSVNKLADTTIVSEVDYIWNVKNFGTNHYFPYIESVLSDTYDLSGAFLKSEQTNNDYDDYGNLLSQITVYSDGQEIHSVNQYDNDLSSWKLGLLRRTDTTYVRPGQPNQVRSAEFSYDPITAFTIEEIIQPGHPTLELTTQYQYDNFGNVSTVTKSAPGINTRSEDNYYGTNGRFLIGTTNALGHYINNTYDPAFGHLLTTTDSNGLVRINEYDGFDRQVSTVNPDGTEVVRYYFLADAASPVNAAHYVLTETTGQAPIVKYFDLLDREIRTETIGFNGQKIFVDTEYNNLGQVSRKSDPYFQGATINWTSFEYDALNRIIKTIQPANRISTISYQTFWPNYKQVSINPLNQSETRYFDARDLYYKIEDTNGVPVEYIRDSVGQILEIKVSPTNRTLMSYDILGNRTRLVTPDQGTVDSTYDALGLLRSKTDNAGLVVTYSYDLLNRPLTQNEPEGQSNWIYDTRPSGIGEISSVYSSNGGYSQDYYYDNLGRTNRTVTTIDGQSYTETITFDAFGRQDKLSYPTGYEVSHVYNSFGYLESIKQTSNGATLWRMTAQNARGQLEQESFGNGIDSKRIYYPETGYLDRILTGLNLGLEVQRLKFTFDPIGNLLWRRDLNIGKREDFTYDTLNRLTSTQVVGGYGTTINYNSIGNITSRSDVGTYNYGANGAGLHALTSVVGPKANTYSYDANGNRVSSNGINISYTSFNKPSSIVQGNLSYQYSYDSNHLRYKRLKTKSGVNPVNIVKHYVGGNYEYESNNGVVTHRHFIFADKQWVAIYTQTGPTQQSAISYLHFDHLGSLNKITNSVGQEIESLSYDAWGMRRPSDWSAPVGSETSSTSYGFTGHEHLDDVDLLDMGGRIYDPMVGRFLSADPIVQAPENLQNLNRYSYVLNNPLSYTDPSGYFFKSLFKSVGKFIKRWGPTIVMTVAILTAQTWVAGVVSSSLASSLTAGAQTLATKLAGHVAGGIAANAVGVAIQGGSISDIVKASSKGIPMSFLTFGVEQTIGARLLEGVRAHFPDFLDSQKLSFSKRIGNAIGRRIGEAAVAGFSSGITGQDPRSSVGLSLIAGGLSLSRDMVVAYNVDPNSKFALSEYGMTFKRGEGVGPKGPGQHVVNPHHNNIGEGHSFDKEPKLLQEGGTLSNFANLVPGMNSFSVFHDNFAGALGLPQPFNALSIPPTFLLHQFSLAVSKNTGFSLQRYK